MPVRSVAGPISIAAWLRGGAERYVAADIRPAVCIGVGYVVDFPCPGAIREIVYVSRGRIVVGIAGSIVRDPIGALDRIAEECIVVGLRIYGIIRVILESVALHPYIVTAI